MNKYEVTGLATVSCSTVVMAKSKEEAVILTRHREFAQLCHKPFIESKFESFHLEAEGNVKELTVELFCEDDEND